MTAADNPLTVTVANPLIHSNGMDFFDYEEIVGKHVKLGSGRPDLVAEAATLIETFRDPNRLREANPHINGNFVLVDPSLQTKDFHSPHYPVGGEVISWISENARGDVTIDKVAMRMPGSTGTDRMSIVQAAVLVFGDDADATLFKLFWEGRE
ncbi:hypothetical protein [Microvirga pudoricolor]|uniref:hypothetical protein n=1 Tax=Microvirga pudoricolor TaxID=2778729 RepID=UPI001951EC9F|nr:hypothetical protein [Microvirga pudoricolor]MBM6595575.1 hypothetical protein [Microvirga pudoricolor]